ncbi:MAG: antibiotic biosynthesis monooxygenase [Sphingobacteriaceae bacterium]|nr:MAG: antibiotic biosynthesis monooxygenase [Sphingobacteriaceae bacterium]
MILEVAVLYVKPGQESGFEKDFKTASQYISSVPGYLRHDLQKCIEQANKYLLLVEWKKLEDHTIGFRQSASYQRWKNLLHHYYDPFPVVEHFKTVLLKES